MTISSMGGIPDEGPSNPRMRHLSKREMATVGAQSVLRLLVGFAFIFWMMSLAPEQPGDSVLYPVSVAVLGVVIYSVLFVRQVKGVYKARFPTLRAIEALILMAAMFLAIFSIIYLTISLQQPGSFTEELDGFSAYYFALTVLATVGFGDITPTTVTSRSFTMVQMALDIAFIAVLIRVMGGAAKRALLARESTANTDEGAGKGGT